MVAYIQQGRENTKVKKRIKVLIGDGYAMQGSRIWGKPYFLFPSEKWDRFRRGWERDRHTQLTGWRS